MREIQAFVQCSLPCLTSATSTAAVHFKNGTTRDLVKIDGSAEYRAAMRQITQDASDNRNGLSSSL
ncbi:hypothetical protein BJX62DRAFT_220275 [Aspergillus germanicus]